MAPKLVVASGKSAGRTISIKRDKLLVGRADECDVRPLSEEVSRRHCAFVVESDALWVEDLRSRNGTFVNGVRIDAKSLLADGDIVRIGNLELKVACRTNADASSHAGSNQNKKPSATPGNAAVAPGDDDEVSRWLMADEEPAGMFDTTLTMRVATDPGAPGDSLQQSPSAEAGGGVTPAEDPDATVIRGRTPAPATNPSFASRAQKKAADTSRDAAAEALKKFFGSR